MLYEVFPSAPQFRAEMRRNFGLVQANNVDEALEKFRTFVGVNSVGGFTASEIVDDESFQPFLVETSHTP